MPSKLELIQDEKVAKIAEGFSMAIGVRLTPEQLIQMSPADLIVELADLAAEFLDQGL